MAHSMSCEDADRFLAEQRRRGHAVSTRAGKAGSLALFYEFLISRYQGQIHRAQRDQAHQSPSSGPTIMYRPYRQTVTDTDHRSTPGHRVANRNHQRRRPSNVDMGRNEPKRIEIGRSDGHDDG